MNLWFEKSEKCGRSLITHWRRMKLRADSAIKINAICDPPPLMIFQPVHVLIHKEWGKLGIPKDLLEANGEKSR